MMSPEQYEYRRETFRDYEAVSQLNELGARGWRVVRMDRKETPMGYDEVSVLLERKQTSTDFTP